MIDVRLFGPQAQLAKRASVPLEIEPPTTCAVVRQRLARAVPALAPTLAASRFAINHEYAQEDSTINAGDEVALIGMVSGG